MDDRQPIGDEVEPLARLYGPDGDEILERQYPGDANSVRCDERRNGERRCRALVRNAERGEDHTGGVRKLSLGDIVLRGESAKKIALPGRQCLHPGPQRTLKIGNRHGFAHPT